MKYKNMSPRVRVVMFILILLCIGIATLVGVGYAVYFKRSDAGYARVLGGWMPAARIGNSFVSYSSFLASRDTMKNYLQSPLAKKQNMDPTLTPDLEKASLQRLMSEKVIQELAKQKKVIVPDADIRGSFAEMIAMSSSTIPNVAEYLKQTFNWNEDQYRENIVKPAILEERVLATMASDTQMQYTLMKATMSQQMAEPNAKIFLKF